MEYFIIGGQKRPFRGDVGAIRKFAEKKGVKDLTKIDEALDGITFDDLFDLIYLTLKSGAKAEKSEFKYTFEEVQEWVDDLDFDDFTELSKKVISSITMGKDLEPPPAQTPKKQKKANP